MKVINKYNLLTLIEEQEKAYALDPNSFVKPDVKLIIDLIEMAREYDSIKTVI